MKKKLMNIKKLEAAIKNLIRCMNVQAEDQVDVNSNLKKTSEGINMVNDDITRTGLTIGKIGEAIGLINESFSGKKN